MAGCDYVAPSLYMAFRNSLIDEKSVNTTSNPNICLAKLTGDLEKRFELIGAFEFSPIQYDNSIRGTAIWKTAQSFYCHPWEAHKDRPQYFGLGHVCTVAICISWTSKMRAAVLMNLNGGFIKDVVIVHGHSRAEDALCRPLRV
ncbi:hypothetical protein EDB19DRAFT_1833310 [Suillus lakei]|nr:hypothetical protein EDB19DRAFT_1833310 [Suillus lakei]